MTVPPGAAALARAIEAAHDEVRQIPPFTSQHPGFDLPLAYAVARETHAARIARGARAVGRKIGFTNPGMWARYGVRAPIWAHVYDNTVEPEAAEHRCSLGRFTEPKIEPEIVLHLRAAPPPGADAAAVLACVDWVAHAFEIVQSHFPRWEFRAADTVADQSLHARLLLGPRQPVERLGADAIGALAAFRVELACDGQVRDSGSGANVLGSPLAAIAHLCAVLAEQRDEPPLAAGELVSTGTLTMAHAVRPGETWRTAIAGIALPGLTVAFVAQEAPGHSPRPLSRA